MTKISLKWPLKIIISISWIIVGIYPKYEKCTLKNTYIKGCLYCKMEAEETLCCMSIPPPPIGSDQRFFVLYIAAF